MQGYVYDVLEGFGGEDRPAVIKTPLGGPSAKFPAVEIDALRDFKKLFFLGDDRDGKQWGVMEKEEGVVLWDHPDFTTAYPKGYNWMSPKDPDFDNPRVIDEKKEECIQFMQVQYDLVKAAIKDAFVHYGWEYLDVNWENFLFTTDKNRPMHVNLIDWGYSKQTEVPPSQREQFWTDLMEPMWQRELSSVESVMPLEDDQRFQGICDSDVRPFFGFEHPRDVLQRVRDGTGTWALTRLDRAHCERFRQTKCLSSNLANAPSPTSAREAFVRLALQGIYYCEPLTDDTQSTT
ncbi:hypothetical protein FRB99_004190 [Tulasnella sp. 403]|nr:hypothetical protein FRB99_004190 [Tulasnella sp. 403]